jgi:hypothetical protein
MSAHNYEYIDRIIIAVEKKIEGQQQVDVNVVKDLLITLKDATNRSMNEIYSTSNNDEQMDLGYD